MLHRKPKNLTREEAINIAIDTMKEAEEERRIVVEKEANVGISYD